MKFLMKAVTKEHVSLLWLILCPEKSFFFSETRIQCLLVNLPCIISGTGTPVRITLSDEFSAFTYFWSDGFQNYSNSSTTIILNYEVVHMHIWWLDELLERAKCSTQEGSLSIVRPKC